LPKARQGADSNAPRAQRATAHDQQTKSISPARWAAFHVLMQVETSSAHSDDLLHGAPLRKLSQPDRNLATALVMGVLRWQIALDAELAKLLDRPDQPLPDEIVIALRMGAFQLRHMDRIPAHAALSESVEIVRAAGHPKAAGLVNAILRKLSAKPAPGKPIVESIDAVAKRLGHPAWMVRRWETTYGREAALAICEYDQHEPASGDLFAHDQIAGDVDANLIDDGSRLIAELAVASHPSPERIWDACAAPGGKTAVLARRHRNAELLATDISARRLQSMRQRLQNDLPDRTIRALEADATQLPTSEGNFDLILCDVPCSGTGTLARNPEIRHRLQPSEFERQAARQREILNAALKRLRPGGRLLYSTCSLEPEENEEVVKSVLARSETPARPRIISIAELLERLRSDSLLRDDAGRLKQLLHGDTLRTLPGANFQGDGFFAAAFAREA
jgi:16S rRNA (cytosine967-C5)-methyltransferase